VVDGATPHLVMTVWHDKLGADDDMGCFNATTTTLGCTRLGYGHGTTRRNTDAVDDDMSSARAEHRATVGDMTWLSLCVRVRG
jgi:hypothetical protein